MKDTKIERKEKTQITEADGVHKSWYVEAKKQTLETLPQFINHLIEDYGHDYKTICHALAAGAVATLYAMNSAPQGGIPGFQACAVMLEYMKNWKNLTGPLRLVKYEDMLYPQYQDKFEKKICKSTLRYLRNEAKKKIEDVTPDCPPHPDVIRHWEEIVEGKIPFGYEVGDENER